MKERLNKLSEKKALFAAALAATSLAGCDISVNAAHKSVGTCGEKSHAHSRAASPKASSPSQLADTARSDVLILQRRALASGGGIDLPRWHGNENVTEIQATTSELTLAFHRNYGGEYNTDTVHFPVHGTSTSIAVGAIACYNNHNQLVANGTFASLQEYVKETAALDR
jgi:hypothetical protein